MKLFSVTVLFDNFYMVGHVECDDSDEAILIFDQILSEDYGIVLDNMNVVDILSDEVDR